MVSQDKFPAQQSGESDARNKASPGNGNYLGTIINLLPKTIHPLSAACGLFRRRAESKYTHVACFCETFPLGRESKKDRVPMAQGQEEENNMKEKKEKKFRNLPGSWLNK